MKLDMPTPDDAIDSNGAFTRTWVYFFSRVVTAIVSRSQSGTTAQRPTIGLEIGLPYYDTTLGYQICVHQVKPTIIWHNGAGVAV